MIQRNGAFRMTAVLAALLFSACGGGGSYLADGVANPPDAQTGELPTQKTTVEMPRTNPPDAPTGELPTNAPPAMREMIATALAAVTGAQDAQSEVGQNYHGNFQTGDTFTHKGAAYDALAVESDTPAAGMTTYTIQYPKFFGSDFCSNLGDSCVNPTNSDRNGLVHAVSRHKWVCESGGECKVAGYVSLGGDKEQITRFYASAAEENVDPSGDDNYLRPGGEDTTVPIVVDVYTDGDGEDIVYVQKLSYAQLGIWLLDNTYDDDGDGTPNEAGEDGLKFYYRPLTENRIAEFPIDGEATYSLEFDILYKGVRFYPETLGGFGLNVNFGTGAVNGIISLDNSFSAFEDVAGVASGGTLANGATIDESSKLGLTFTTELDRSRGEFIGSNFEPDPFGSNAGFFEKLANPKSGLVIGHFYDNPATYDQTTAPAEVGGHFTVKDSDGETLDGGFLGSVSTQGGILPPSSP